MTTTHSYELTSLHNNALDSMNAAAFTLRCEGDDDNNGNQISVESQNAWCDAVREYERVYALVIAEAKHHAGGYGNQDQISVDYATYILTLKKGERI